MNVDFWTNDRVERLVEAWSDGEGLSAAAIAELLSCSKNAVIGKLDRLELLQPAPRPTSAARARFEGIAAAFEERGDHGCAWPIGDPSEPGFRFCGEERPYVDCAYCETHAAEAYVPRKRGTKITKSAPAPANADRVAELEQLLAA
jgi:GcrA cell cycle regulator